MKKVLKIQILSSPSRSTDTYTFKIVEQSHRNSDFGDGNTYFIASSGFELTSSSHPEVGTASLYVLGHDRREDGKILRADGGKFRLIEAAIQEYNAFFSGKEKPLSQNDYLKRMGIVG